jgi:phospholipase C
VKRVVAGTIFACAGAILGGCSASAPTNAGVGTLPNATAREPSLAGRQAVRSLRRFHSLQWPITNVVVIVQENRTVDNLFQFLPGANTQSWGYNHKNQVVKLQPESLSGPYGPGHMHSDWEKEYNGGAMNGFDRESCGGGCPVDAVYAYVPQKQVQPYYTLAEEYAFADEMFESDQGPSFAAHQYLLSGTSTVSQGSPNKAADNPNTPNGTADGGCDSPKGTLGDVITPQGTLPSNLDVYPCFQREALMNEMDSAGISWRYYQDQVGAGLWHGVDAIYSIWSNPSEMASNVIAPPPQALNDIQSGNLANVVWITPESWYSDHPATNDGAGPSWVAAVVNAIGESPYWENTAIFITWDDWGGWYDHVTPTIYNSFELGFRVPLVIVSPYARPGYVSHVQHEFGSILKFTEEAFGLPSLGTTDARADDLSDCFDFNQPGHAFRRIPAKYSRSYFLLHHSEMAGQEE